VALEVVKGAIGDYQAIRADVNGIVRRLDDLERFLLSRQRLLDGLIAGLTPPAPDAVPDQLVDMENIQDVEHQIL
jgi:hypothetical protein